MSSRADKAAVAEQAGNGAQGEGARKVLPSSALVTVGACTLGLMVLSFGLKDPFIPFESITFMLAIVAIAVMEFIHGVAAALVMASGTAALHLCAMLWHHPEGASIPLWTWPIFVLFYFLAALLPALAPLFYSTAARTLLARVKGLEKRLASMERSYKEEYRKRTKDRMDEHKQQLVYFSSRLTILNGYARNVLQASTSKELLNIMFHALTKHFKPATCLLLSRLEDGQYLVARAVHPEREELEESRIPGTNPYFQQLAETRAPIFFESPVAVLEKTEASMLLPVYCGHDEESAPRAVFIVLTNPPTLGEADLFIVEKMAVLTSEGITLLEDLMKRKVWK